MGIGLEFQAEVALDAQSIGHIGGGGEAQRILAVELDRLRSLRSGPGFADIDLSGTKGKCRRKKDKKRQRTTAVQGR